MSVGEPAKKLGFEKHSKDGVSIYVENTFPRDLPKIVIQLHRRAGGSRLVASRRG